MRAVLSLSAWVVPCLSHAQSPVAPLQSRYNVGWARFLADETTEFHDLALSWERDTAVPAWVRGSYVKNGPSQKRFGTEERWYSQYMDSWAKLNKITFTGDGEVLYSGRMIESKNYLR